MTVTFGVAALFLFIAAMCYALAAVGVASPRVSFTNLGHCFVALAGVAYLTVS